MFKINLKVFITLFLLCIISSTLFSQTDSIKIDLIPYWNLGDTYEFKVTKTDRSYYKDILDKDDTTSYIATLEVLDTTDYKYKLKWTIKNNFPLLDYDEAYVKAFEQASKLEVIYQLDEYGNIDKIINWKEIAFRIKLATRIVLKRDDLKENKELQIKLNSYLKLLDSEENVLSILVPEISYLHCYFGSQYIENEVIEYDNFLPNPIKPTYLNAISTFKVNEIDTTEFTCVFEENTVINEKDSKKLLLDMMEMMEFEDKKEIRAIKKGYYRLSDNSIFEFYYYPGIPKKIEIKRNGSMKVGDEHSTFQKGILIELLQ